MTNSDLLVALAGQQNAGKSTLFNVLTGARQHVANYPGVTVDKKYGVYRDASGKVTAVDLPGTYSLTSFSLEERVARDFLLIEKPDVTVNVVDASNLKRSLHLTLQLTEMGLPTVLALNMMDVVERRGTQIDRDLLSERLGVPVVATVGRKGEGREALRSAIRTASGTHAPARCSVDYGDLETDIAALEAASGAHGALADIPGRWLALKLLEDDRRAVEIVRQRLAGDAADALIADAGLRAAAFATARGIDVPDHVVACRDRAVRALLDGVFMAGTRETGSTVTERIDRFVLNRFAAPLFLVFTVFMIYQVAIVWGYELTEYTWPLLAHTREFIAGLLPDAGFLTDPYIRSMGLWLVDSANTLLNYVPIFLILFALIAMLEDSGYMARIAFILDKVLHRFGLHGQSTLPLILGGVFAGGCAVPGVMATKGIPDNRARMATIFAVPFMNCLAKVPLYTLLLGIFFVENRSLMMFYISTITVIFALLVSKLLTKTVLSGQETSPFVMELPTYHLPTVKGVVRRAVDRTWLYVKKVGTIVIAVAVVVFTLLQFPGLSDERWAHFQTEGAKAIATFETKMAGNAYADIATGSNVVGLINFSNDYKRAKLNASGASASSAVNDSFEAANPAFYALVRPPRGDADAKAASRALRSLVSTRKTLRREMKEERIRSSLLGTIGRGMEPVTQFAGFDWKINVALLSSFAARESSVATLGVLFQQDEDQNASLETRMGAETTAAGATALLAVSMILFFALYPPCLATTVMVKIQTGSYKWMMFSILFPTVLGLTVSSAVYSIGKATGASGIEAMTAVYFGSLALLIVVGLFGRRRRSAFLPTMAHRPSLRT
ncbi:ferrous iron transport protein B [Rhodobium orientis]|uniref:Ferrous iron transport protein B n=1 Tax=Rhodobium orientis TaxID=34017 RepID=A0A327JJD6_9HYPH|nr:ferrous iron transport protein B [Rhodobium orientis]MBB4305419.1 ferrous iron transport protein B [Rhodobium orientis]MBK5948328.1 ferrous iron transport protein B [Rhodobium orientis]RAI25504.1 ferrous iron transport protein B [Rhodobium orientis]